MEQGGNVKRILIINNRNSGDKKNGFQPRLSTVLAENGARCFAYKPHTHENSLHNLTQVKSNTISVFSSSSFPRQKARTCLDRSAVMHSVPNVTAFVWLRGYRKDER